MHRCIPIIDEQGLLIAFPITRRELAAIKKATQVGRQVRWAYQVQIQ